MINDWWDNSSENYMIRLVNRLRKLKCEQNRSSANFTRRGRQISKSGIVSKSKDKLDSEVIQTFSVYKGWTFDVYTHGFWYM